jgi:hypothetical protein
MPARNWRSIDSLSGILSPGLLASFALLGLFPAAGAQDRRHGSGANKVFSAWKRPRRFDRNLVVIGAGSAGLVTSYIAAAVKAKVTLVEKHHMGGDCLNTGCVPSKALIRSAKLLSHIARAKEFGIASAHAASISRGHGTGAERHPDGRAARLGRALQPNSASMWSRARQRSFRHGRSRSAGHDGTTQR